MVDCEHRSRPEGRHSSAILNTGSMRRLVASLPSSYPAAIISSRKRMMSASVCTVLPGIAPILDAGGQTLGNPKLALDLAHDQQTSVGRQAATVEPGDHFFPGNR